MKIFPYDRSKTHDIIATNKNISGEEIHMDARSVLCERTTNTCLNWVTLMTENNSKTFIKWEVIRRDVLSGLLKKQCLSALLEITEHEWNMLN